MAKRSKRHAKSRRRISYFFAFLLSALLIVGGYLFLTREAPLSQKEFSNKVLLVDQIIQGQLYEMGIQKKDILLQQALSKKERGLTWKQSSLKVRVPPSLPFSLIEENFRRSLSALGTPFSIQSSQTQESLRLEIRVMDRITHQLTFIPATPSILKKALRPKIAIVIDDLGGENKISRELLRWDFPVTLSILPFTPYSKTLAGEAHRKGKEVILHLPMEPHGYPQIRPGEGVLLEEMDETRLLHQLSKDIEAVPYIKGVNNHMGSRLMESPEKLEIIFSELKRRGLFFLDSRTTAQSVGFQVAQSVGLKAAERNVFIDNSSAEEDVKGQLEQLIRLSLVNGKAIGIGHPHLSTLKAIKEMVPKIKEKGIDIVPLSEVLE
jgi:hypothetical protein